MDMPGALAHLFTQGGHGVYQPAGLPADVLEKPLNSRWFLERATPTVMLRLR